MTAGARDERPDGIPRRLHKPGLIFQAGRRRGVVKSQAAQSRDSPVFAWRTGKAFSGDKSLWVHTNRGGNALDTPASTVIPLKSFPISAVRRARWLRLVGPGRR